MFTDDREQALTQPSVGGEHRGSTAETALMLRPLFHPPDGRNSMTQRLCPHDQTPLVGAQQLFYPVHLQSPETTRLKALITGDGGVQAQPHACTTCGFVAFYLEPEQVAALRAT